MKKNSHMSSNSSIIHFPLLQISLMGLTVVAFVFFLFKPFKEFRSEDTGPHITEASKTLIQKVTDANRMVDIDLYIEHSPRFYLKEDKFSFRGEIVFTFDPNVISLETIKEFDIEKGVVTKSEPYITKTNGKTIAHFFIEAHFTMKVDFADYPFDDHRLTFAIINPKVTPKQLLFSGNLDHFTTEEKIAMGRWKEIAQEVTTGYIEKEYRHETLRYPAALFTIDYVHSAIRHTTIVLFPLILIFFLATFGLSLNAAAHHGIMITLAATGISALMAYRYVVEDISPKVGYFMLSDYLFFLFMFVIFLVFIISLFIERIQVKNIKWFIMALYLAVISLCGYLMLIWL